MEAPQERMSDEGPSSRNLLIENGDVNKGLIKIRIKRPRSPVTFPVKPAALEDHNVIPNPNVVESASLSKKKRKSHVGYDDDVVGSHVCVICAKGFPSKKSLYGHMRTHPDRPRKGIQPPSLSPPKCNNSVNEARKCSSFSELDHVDPFPNGWSVKGKRGRDMGRNPSVSSDSSLSSVGSEHSTLALILRQLFRELHEKELKRERRKSKARVLGSTKPEWDSDDEYWLQDCFPPGWDDDFRRNFETRKADELGLSKDRFRINGGVEGASMNQRRKIERSSHHVTKSTDMFASAADVIKLEESDCYHTDAVGPTPGFSHQCQTCGQEFPTGQALGGHMRKHYKKPAAETVESGDEPVEPIAESVEPVAGQDESPPRQDDSSDRGTSRVFHEFDLNEPTSILDSDDE